MRKSDDLENLWRVIKNSLFITYETRSFHFSPEEVSAIMFEWELPSNTTTGFGGAVLNVGSENSHCK